MWEGCKVAWKSRRVFRLVGFRRGTCISLVRQILKYRDVRIREAKCELLHRRSTQVDRTMLAETQQQQGRRSRERDIYGVRASGSEPREFRLASAHLSLCKLFQLSSFTSELSYPVCVHASYTATTRGISTCYNELPDLRLTRGKDTRVTAAEDLCGSGNTNRTSRITESSWMGLPKDRNDTRLTYTWYLPQES